MASKKQDQAQLNKIIKERIALEEKYGALERRNSSDAFQMRKRMKKIDEERGMNKII